MNTSARDPPVRRQGGQKWQNVRAAGFQRGGQFGADVAAQRGIGLFIYVGNSPRGGFFHRAEYDVIGSLRRKVACFRHQYQHFAGIVHRVAVRRRICHHAGWDAPGGKLYAGIQSAGEIVREDQQFDHILTSPSILNLSAL